MRSTVVRLWRFCQTPEGLKVVRYTLVSAISALTSLIILTVVYGVLRLWTEVISTLFANVMAGIPSYILNRRWVWGKSGRSHIWREILPFWVMSLHRHRICPLHGHLGPQFRRCPPPPSPGPDGPGGRGQRGCLRHSLDPQIPHPQPFVRPDRRRRSGCRYVTAVEPVPNIDDIGRTAQELAC